MRTRHRDLRAISLIAIVALALVIGLIAIIYHQSADQEAYREVIATMSLEKAQRFFETFPESQYRDKLVSEIIGWCRAEETQECYEMIIATLPRDHPGHVQVIQLYESEYQDPTHSRPTR